MNSFNVGPQVLESLTQGLYEGEAKNSRMYVYREYIQNAADAIDEAIDSGILDPDFGRIIVRTDSKDRKITIADNGVGVSIDEIYVLLNIGASKKDGKNTRGFRGIGRLSGISYCDTLRFTTSAYGEDKKTVITYDCKTIRERLKEKDINRQSLESFLENLVAYDTLSEEKDKHYFVVEMFGVNVDTILDKEEVKKYLEQTAPIDFDSQKFFEAHEIKRHFKELGITIPSYKIYFNDNIPLSKPYSSVFYKDQIYMVEYIYETASDGSPLFAGWVGFTGLKSVLPDEIGGIRLRKGNILVGDADTFSGYFVGKKQQLKNDRIAANKCFVGEIHVLHPLIYPNSKRDSFEESDSKFYGEMKQKLIQWTEPLDHDYRRGISDIRSALGRFDDTKETGYKGTLKKFNVDVKKLQETQTTLATYLKYNPEFSKQIENGLKKSEKVRGKLVESEVRSELHVVSGKRLEPSSVSIDYYKEHIFPKIADIIREYLKTNYGGVVFSNIAEELIAEIAGNQLLAKQRTEAVKIAI